jgi:peptidoglycan/xylan/chitin deacetylase (PgdA/CDA1 family)
MNVDGKRWPREQRMALVLTVDFFDDAAILTQEPRMAGRAKSLSVWQYGATRGVERLLQAFEEADVRTSWFVPGIVAQRHPALLRRIHAAGHEIGNATFACDNFDSLPLAAQRASLQRAQAAIADVTGEAPIGFRAPFGNWAPGFADVLGEAGFQWSSSWRGDDRPYFHHQPGAAQAQRVVELPLHYELEDEPYFTFNLFPPIPAGQPRIASYREALANFKQDFDGFHRFGLCLPMRIHPEILGTAGRIDLLRDFIAHAKVRGQVWFAKGQEVAAWWKQNHEANEAGHPADVFAPHHTTAIQP